MQPHETHTGIFNLKNTTGDRRSRAEDSQRRSASFDQGSTSGDGSDVSYCIDPKANTLSAVDSSLGALDTTHWLEPMKPDSRIMH